MKERVDYYILFANYTHGLLLQKLLKEEGITSRIAPTPKAIQGELNCGMSLLIEEEQIENAKKCIEKNDAEYYDIVSLKNQIQPKRNKFC